MIVTTRQPARGADVAELPAGAVDRSSALPLYAQLESLLAGAIRRGRWQPGERVPSEPAIGSHYEVSRTTVRQALDELEREGLIRRERGRGTFVAEPRSSWLLQSSASFHETASRHGHSVTSRVLRREVVELPEWAAESLELDAGAEGLVLERLRELDGEVVMYVRNFLPTQYERAVRDADLETGSLYAALRRTHGLAVGGGRRVVDAVAADPELARMLDLGGGQPVLFVESVSLDLDRRPFECYRAWHRPDRSKIEVQVVTSEVAEQVGIDTSGVGPS